MDQMPPLPSREEAVEETRKRLKIAEEITSGIKDCTEGVIIGGSVGWGANTAVRKGSDIDMPIIVKPENIFRLSRSQFFAKKMPQKAMQSFADSKLDGIWVRNTVDGVEINNFIYNHESYKGFCALKSGLKMFTNAFVPKGMQYGYGFGGEFREFKIPTGKLGYGCTYTRPNLDKNHYYADALRIDHLYSCRVAHEASGFVANVSNTFWRNAVHRLKIEYGPDVDLNRQNLLNTHYVFKTRPEALPKETVEKIRKRTASELSKLD